MLPVESIPSLDTRIDHERVSGAARRRDGTGENETDGTRVVLPGGSVLFCHLNHALIPDVPVICPRNGQKLELSFTS